MRDTDDQIRSGLERLVDPGPIDHARVWDDLIGRRRRRQRRRVAAATVPVLMLAGIITVGVSTLDRSGDERSDVAAVDGNEVGDDAAFELSGRTFNGDTVEVAGAPRPLAPDTTITLSFPVDQASGNQRISWNAGCNNWGATLLETGPVLQLDEVGSTHVFCGLDDLDEQERWLQDFFTSGPSWRFDGDSLTLTSGETLISLTDQDHETVAAEVVPSVGQERDDGTVPTPIGDADLVGGGLSFVAGSCNQNPTAEVDENDTTVTITAYAPPRGNDGESCADGLVVHLEQPLGDRMVIDGATGMTVAVRRPGWVIPGDHVRIVSDYTFASESSDAAVLFDGPDELAQVWPETGVPGPAPAFDGERSDAVLIRVSEPSVCPELYEALIVDANLLRFQVMAEDGSERPCTSPAQPGHRVVVALVAERTPGRVPDGMAAPLEAVSYRERQLPLERPDTE